MAAIGAMRGRVAHLLAGATAGLSGWLLSEVLPDWMGESRAYLWLAFVGGAFFILLLLALGPLRLGRAAGLAASIAVPGATLELWASLRYDSAAEFLGSGRPAAAFVAFCLILLPFGIAGLRARGGWRDYAGLFALSWATVVRAMAALLFVALVWAVLWLSDALLRLVGLSVIGDLLTYGPVPWIVCGAILGLALAVVAELSDFISAYLLLRLLRLLVPLVLAVTAVFLAAIPIRGFTDPFGSLSVATTLFVVALAAISLVSIAVDQADDDAVRSTAMRLAVRALALLTPILAGLGCLSVVMRVSAYGWTPDRVAAMTAGVLLLAYGLVYTAAVASGPAWMRRIRQGNLRLAVAVAAVAALWLTPVLDAERISARSQVERFLSGKVDFAALDVWTIGRDWGRAGEAAIETLRRSAPAVAGSAEDEVAQRLNRLAMATSREEFDAPNGTEVDPGELLGRLPVVPASASLQPGHLPRAAELVRWRDACDRSTPAGRPGCIAVVADFVPELPGDETVVLLLREWGEVEVLVRSGSEGARPGSSVQLGSAAPLTGADIDRLAQGAYQVAPVTTRALVIGSSIILPRP